MTKRVKQGELGGIPDRTVVIEVSRDLKSWNEAHSATVPMAGHFSYSMKVDDDAPAKFFRAVLE